MTWLRGIPLGTLSEFHFQEFHDIQKCFEHYRGPACSPRPSPCADAVMALSRQENEAGEVAERIDESHDLGGRAAVRLADGLIVKSPLAPVPCRWTFTMVPSIIAYSKSGSPDRARKMRSKTPFLAQRRKRFDTDPHLPNCGGRSRHGAPARTSQSTASTNRRLSAPERPGSPSLPGRSGAIRAHCSSFNTSRFKVDLHFPALNQASITLGKLVSRHKSKSGLAAREKSPSHQMNVHKPQAAFTDSNGFLSCVSHRCIKTCARR